MMNIDINGS